MRYLPFLLILTGLLFSCRSNRLKIDVSNIKIDFEVKRLDQSLFEIDTADIENGLDKLKSEYGDFYDIFTQKMISIGGQNDSVSVELAKKFIADTMIINVKKLVDKEFNNFPAIEKELNDAFKHYKFYFPGKDIPTVYTCISGFNQSIVVARGLVGVSLDNYLGAGCPYYSMLAFPQYKKQRMYKEKMVSDILYGWSSTEFINAGKENNLLSNMIHEGKLMYILDAMLPDTHDSVKIGFTKKQLDWCQMNEAQMWNYLIANKKLYVTGRMDIKRFIGDAPYTNGFPLESPGRAAVWIGWQIVKQYMDKYPEVTLSKLMNMGNAQELLNASAYLPE